MALAPCKVCRIKSAMGHKIDQVTGQVLPPTAEGLLKFCVDVSFTNTSWHAKSAQMISAPPDTPDQDQHTIPKSLRDECMRVVKGIYGKELENAEFDSFRICWYEKIPQDAG